MTKTVIYKKQNLPLPPSPHEPKERLKESSLTKLPELREQKVSSDGAAALAETKPAPLPKWTTQLLQRLVLARSDQKLT